MGMVWVARLANDEQAARILSNPDLAYDFINPEDYVDHDEIVDLDKEWHATHHLLTGSADACDSPLSLIVGDFEGVGEDNGYSPAWFIPPAALQSFSVALSDLDRTELGKRFNPDAMVEEQVYIGDAIREEGQEGLGYLLERVAALRSFAARAAAKGSGAFAVIT